MSDSYTAASGKSIYGGMLGPNTSGRPTWRVAMAINTWAQVPGNTLSSIDPENNPSINPNYPSASPWKGNTGQASLVSAYNGATWNETTGDLWLPLQGGHQDYAGNEPYVINLMNNNPTWKMVRNPSGAVGNVIVLNDGQEATGVYADGRLRSPHSYNYNIYVPGIGPVVSRLPGVYQSGQTGLNKAFKINETTGESSLLSDYSALAGGSGNGYLGGYYGGSAYDPTRNCIWELGTEDARLVKIDLASGTGTFVVPDYNYTHAYCSLIYMKEYDLLGVYHNGGTGYKAQFFLFDLANNYAVIEPATTGAWSPGLSTTYGSNGVAWDGTRLLIWGNTSNTTDISTLTPSGDPRTQPWVKNVIGVSGSNTVTPTVQASVGTWSRFGYSKTLGGCYLLNATNQQLYFFATE